MIERGARQRRRLSGPARLAIAWIAAIGVGTALLRLPPATTLEPLTWIDALFTAASAVCVTGLSTIAVGDRLSLFGEIVLLGLIQLGGLGITTVSTFLLVAAGRATLTQQFGASEALAGLRVHPVRLIWWVLAVTVAIEALGAWVLRHVWGADGSWWVAIFHSVSAFCNAGFALFADSLVVYRADPAVNAAIAALIVLGGLGFIALYQMASWCRGMLTRRRRRLVLHARVVLAASLVLWAAGGLMFATMEWGGSMHGLPMGEKLLAAMFQSVTTRTAGFNTLDFSTMREPTLFFTMFLMIIGGAPGGCAGGVKVTTVVVILAAVRARFRGTESLALFNRAVPAEVVRRSHLLVTLSVIFLTLVVAGLLVAEEVRPVSEIRTDRFLLLAFEAVSAFGTVGLSAGVTADLSAGGKLLIIVCMFVGRLGPLVVALAVIQPRSAPRYAYPEEEVAIG